MEESLLGGGNATEENVENTEAVSEGPSWGSEDWQMDKFESAEDQAKAYVDLQSRFGGFVGAPEEYTFEFPEDSGFSVDMEDPMTEKFIEFAKNTNMDNATANMLMGMYAENLQAQLDANAPDMQAELAALGPNAEARIQVINDYAQSNLNEQEMAALEAATTTAAGVALVEKLILNQTAEPSFGANQDKSAASGMTQADVEEMMQDPRYYEQGKIGEQYRAQVSAAWQRLFPHG